MKFFACAALTSLVALMALPASAAPKKMTLAQLDLVVAGHDYHCPPEERVKGNNGWGNGADPTNPGSFSGATAPSKSTNSSILGGGINENPTMSSGR